MNSSKLTISIIVQFENSYLYLEVHSQPTCLRLETLIRTPAHKATRRPTHLKNLAQLRHLIRLSRWMAQGVVSEPWNNDKTGTWKTGEYNMRVAVYIARNRLTFFANSGMRASRPVTESEDMELFIKYQPIRNMVGSSDVIDLKQQLE
ncbi:hypothetical protein J7T55_006228 [Diaporthe amygdali]|uniref:uncharacterized protein n=1 Tax=Phomopsis amygdali TaxID=1214568 RepID=UPI0022FDEB15|nr:uncharacterized protein J7T55_006228 [Diaporthe amygdali]KAJ0124885.1 hypothetical protein J7T55_006228 [Diaporthe amygdali]